MPIFRKGRKEKKHAVRIEWLEEVDGDPTFVPEDPKPTSWHRG
jgi:hypothetical protein